MFSIDFVKESFEKNLKKYMEENDYTRNEALNALYDDLYYYGKDQEIETAYKCLIEKELGIEFINNK